MAKGKSTWKYNKLLTARRNYFTYGGSAENLPEPTLRGGLVYPKANRSFLGLDWSNPFKGENAGDIKNGIVSSAGQAIGSIGGGYIGGGLQSGVGNALQGLSGIASAIPGPWGAVASAGLGILGGLTNRMFGSKMNTENIAKVEANINNLNSFQSNASDYDTLASNWANADVGMTFDDSFIGQDGWFSDKAKNKAADLRTQVDAGNTWVHNTLTNNAQNIQTTQMQNLLGNYTAFGGPVLRSKGKKKYKNGGNLEFGFGGNVGTLSVNGGDFPMPGNFISINNGGSHEANPYEGVPLGVDPEGVPNLVEEGETVFNDYVFSKRLKVPKAIRDKYKLRGTKELSFAEASKKLAKESEERPNDPISTRGLEAMMADLANAQEQERVQENKGNTFSRGGKMGNLYSGEETTPQTIRHMIRNKDGNPTSLEEKYWYFPDTQNGYTWEDTYGSLYTRANNGKYEDTIGDDGTITRTYYYDPVNKKGSNRYYKKDNNGNYVLVEGDNPYLDIQNSGRYTQTRSVANDSGGTDYYYDLEEEDPKYKKLSTGLRYTPAIGLGIASITDALGWTNTPDYGNAGAVLEASKGTYQPVRFKPVGNYLTYKPFDRDFYINKLNAQAGATRRNLLNTSGGNRATAMAGILAADNNYLNQLGSLARQAEEYNLAQRTQVEEFNRGTNTTNSQGFLQADLANQKAFMQSREQAFKGAMAAAEMRERARLASEDAKSANLSGFITSLGDIGRENMAWNWRNFGIATGSHGNLGDEEYLLENTGKKKSSTKEGTRAKRGKIKRKKGLTI